MEKENRINDNDHDTLIRLETKFDTFMSTQWAFLMNKVDLIHNKLNDKAEKKDLDGVEERVKVVEGKVRDFETTVSGISKFLGLSWQTWLGILAILSFFASIMDRFKN